MAALMQTNPAKVIEKAVNGMLPHTYLSAKMKRRLRVYAGEAPGVVSAKPKTAAKETAAGASGQV
jgi:large subunit ribosomal protein L13